MGEGVELAVERLRALVADTDERGARAVYPISIEARNDIETLIAALTPSPDPALERLRGLSERATQGEWRGIATAPKDGTLFLARNADHPEWGSWPMLRSVRHVYRDGEWSCLDMGDWLHVQSIEPDYENGSTPVEIGVPFAIAPDKCNTSLRYEWQPLPGSALAALSRAEGGVG